MSLNNNNHQSILKNINELLDLGVKNRNHSFHTPVFSTYNKNNHINSRIVVLRKYDNKSLTLCFNTDIRSPKISEIKNNKHSYFLFYDFKLKIQLRIMTTSIIHNKNKFTTDAWNLTPLQSRKCYLTQKKPSSKTTRAEDAIPKNLIGINPSNEESQKGYKNFTVIENIIQNIDWLHLASSGHRRLNINFEKNKPKYNWLIP